MNVVTLQGDSFFLVQSSMTVNFKITANIDIFNLITVDNYYYLLDYPFYISSPDISNFKCKK